MKHSLRLVRASAFAALLGSAAVGSAHAQDPEASAYCRRVAAHQRSEAALMWAPRLFVQGMRYPSSFDIGPATPSGFQLRAGMSYSVLEPFRALALGVAADADCAAHNVQEELEQTVDRARITPELAAYRAQSSFLLAQQPLVDAIVQRAQARLKQHTITLYELNHILSLSEQVERKAAQASGLAAQRDAVGGGASAAKSGRDVNKLKGELSRLRNEQEDSLSSARAYDAWGLRVLGGVIPLQQGNLDFFGWVELSYSVGGLFRSAAESTYREAKQEELLTDPHELLGAHKRLLEEQLRQAEQAAIELRVVDKRIKYLTETAQELQSSESQQTFELDALTVERLGFEAEHIYLTTLIDAIKQEGGHLQ